MKISEAKRQVMLQQWTERIKEQKASGMKVNARCKERGIGEGQFYYCQKQVRQTLPDSVSFPLFDEPFPLVSFRIMHKSEFQIILWCPFFISFQRLLVTSYPGSE